MRTDIIFDQVYIACTERVIEKYTGDGTGFITYSNTIYFMVYG